MKKFASLVLGSLLLATAGSAQEFYIRAGLGYSFPQASQTLDGTGTPYSGSASSTTYTSNYSLKDASFSSGTNAALGIGYLFNDHVGVQLDANFNLSGKTYSLSVPNVSYSGYTANETITQQAKTDLILMPSLVLQTGGDGKWNLYGRFGLALPVSTKITQDQIFYIPQETDDYTFKIKNSFSLGFTGALGVQYRVNDKMSVWGEMSLLSMSLFIKESDPDKVTANGTNIPLSSVQGLYTVKYSKNVTVDTSYTREPAYSQPFSSLGLKVGVSFTLGKHEHSKAGRKDDDLIDDSKPFRRRN